MEQNNLRTTANKFGVPIIRTKSQDMLQDIVIKSKPTKILEIGTAIGFSGIMMLKNSNAKLLTIEHNKDYIKQAKANFKAQKLSSRAKIIDRDCMVALANLACNEKYKGYFDFIFLDGPKAQYLNMLDLLLILLAPGGTFVADNVLFRGYIEGSKTPVSNRYKTIIQRLNKFIENCKNNPLLENIKLYDIEDGMIYAKKVL